MALMTYILLSGAVAGSKGRFDPELLSIAASQGRFIPAGPQSAMTDQIASFFYSCSIGDHLFRVLLYKTRMLFIEYSRRWSSDRLGSLFGIQICRVSRFPRISWVQKSNWTTVDDFWLVHTSSIIVSLLASLAGLRSSICWAIFVYVFAANAFFLVCWWS
jgi:hypothetical protein